MVVFLAIIAVLAVIVGWSALLAFVFMLLWNFVVPQVFNGPEISFWVAWAGMLLLSILKSGVSRVVVSK